MALRLTLNGREQLFDALSETASLDDLIAILGLKSDRVAVEHNGHIVPRTDWPTNPLSEGDRLELVHFVGGGSGTLPASTAEIPAEDDPLSSGDPF